MKVAVCLTALIGLALAGCVAPEVSNPNVTMTVTSASSQSGTCLFASGSDKVCHTLNVHVVNGNTEEDVDNNMFYWEAVSAKGGVFSAPDATGPDAIAAGSQGDIVLKFDVTDGSNLVTLRYEALWMSNPVTASVPSYDAASPAGPKFTINVTGATKKSGDCWFESDPEVCHTLTVTIDNRNNSDDFSTNMYYWKGVSASGGVSEGPKVEGSDAIAAGSQGQITVGFDVTDGSNLVKLRYNDFSNNVEVTVPSY